jgi:hypothetical protein
MFAATFPKPRMHLTVAAKAQIISLIKDGRHAPRNDIARRAPLISRGRQYLPIDDDVPLPEAAGVVEAMPMALMQVGQSFFRPANGTSSETLIKRTKWIAKEHTPRRFHIEATIEDGIEGCRVWRIK